MYWNRPALYFPEPEKVHTEYQLYGLNRSWWYPERDDGELFNHFTNLIHVTIPGNPFAEDPDILLLPWLYRWNALLLFAFVPLAVRDFFQFKK